MPSTAITHETPPASPPLQPSSHEEALANAEPGDTIATTKEEEWVTKKKSEVTTTRQIATRVKRELLLEDGRILSDSGPKVSTSVNEDTHTTNYQQTEHRVPDEEYEEENQALGYGGGAIGAPRDKIDAPRSAITGEVVPAGGKVVVSSSIVANPDGKVRESHDLKVKTRNVVDRVHETEERFHRGDTTHDALIAAVNETSEDDIRDALRTQTENQLALVPSGPRVVKDTVAYKTYVDTDDTRELRALRPDGTIVTERRHTKEQEQQGDQEADEVRSLASDKSLVQERSGREKRSRVDHERSTDMMAGGRRVATHLQSRTRTEEAEREGQPNMDEDWDSLSVRMRRQRRLRQSEQDKDFSKRPLDFDIEEETRKKETSKWLESHFGSESRSSHDSIADELARRPEAYYVKTKPADDEGYYEKTSPAVPPPPVYGDRVLRKTKSSTPSDERAPVPAKTGGYFKGVADWSQRRASKPRMPEPRSASPSPPAVRSPYGSNDRLNGSSPRHVYGKRSSPAGRSSPVGRRHPPSRDDSAYVSSSTMHSPPRGSPFRPLEADRSFREPSLDDDYRPPVAPERKRHNKQRITEEHRYDSGYRSSSRNETSGRSRDSRDEGAAEPPPDYSPPRERRGSSDRDRTPPRRQDRKQHQKTRFAAESGRRASPARKSVGSAIGNSIRKLVGKIRSASAERRARWRNSRSPSPAEHSSRTYRQYGGELAPPGGGAPTRYYLGEDPFAPSIYGREHKYEASARRAAATDARDHRDRGQFSNTLGRFSHSTSRLNPSSEADEDYSRSAQTLPRKLHDRKEKPTEPQKPSSNKYWHKLTPSKRSSSAVNVSNIHVSSAPDGKVNGYPPGPTKPARTYKALNRSKSFAMGAPEPDTHPRYVSGMSRNYSTMYKSNPHLSRLDETPEQLKSPGIVSIINRSQRDLADAVSRETERRRDGVFNTRYGKTTPTNGHTNGYKHDETDKRKLFLKGLRDRAPELYHTLHDDESDGSRLSSRYGTPSPGYKERTSEERRGLYKTESLNRDTSPFVSRLESRLKSPALRRGSNSSDNYSETYRYSTRTGDPERPSVTDTVETVSKKVLPSRDGRSKEVIESREVNSMTKSRGYKGEPLSLKYIENGSRSSPLGYEARNGTPLYSERRSSNYKVMEKVRDY